MGSPIPPEVRERVISAIEDGATWRGAARMFQVGEASVIRWMRRHREEGTVAPLPMGGRRRGLTDEDIALVGKIYEEKPDRTIEEGKDAFEERTGRSTSTGAISRALQKLGLTRKKKATVASERETERVQELRARFQASQAGLNPERLVFIDETGSTVSMTRPFARAPAGRVPTELLPRNRGTVTTVIGALTSRGLTALMAIEGGTDREVFVAYVREVLLPELRPSDIVLLDNVGAHKDPRVRDLIEGVGAHLWFLPPYSPDLNPIEECWSKVKGFLKTAKARTREALELALAMAAECVSPSDARGWFKHAGYVNST